MLNVAATPVFTPGSQELFLLDFAGTRVGTFPRGIQRLSGTMDVVIHDGMSMLRATEFSEFLITLPSALPQNFTIEVDIVPKDGGPQPDLALEGTPEINRSAGSAHLLWMGDASFGYVSVIGGSADNYEFPMPDDLRVTLPMSLARVGVSVQGGTIAFFTNGRQLYSVAATFARGRVLRVTLGGEKVDDATNRPVYLARVRVAASAPTMVTAIAPIPAGTITPLSTAQPAPSPTASGPRTIALNGFTAAGGSSVVRAQTIQLAALVANGAFPGVSTHTIALAPITAVGTNPPPTGGLATLAPKSIALPAVLGSGGSAGISPRLVALPGMMATGGAAGPRPRTVALPAFTASGPVKIP